MKTGPALLHGQPLVSICMGVYNAEPYVAKAIKSIVDQEYPCFELLISDNGSRDRSGEICRSFAAKDPRIFYRCNDTNINPLKNSELLLEKSSGEFLVWAADHDLYHPKFLSMLINEFNANDDSVALCYPRTVVIDKNDNVIQLAPDRLDTRGMDVFERFRKVIWGFHWGNMVNGLFRTNAMKKIWKPYEVVGPDHLLIADLSLDGTIAQVDEKLFYRRRNRPSETPQEAKERYINLFSKTAYEALIPYTMLAHEHINLVRGSAIEPTVKSLLYKEIIKCFSNRFNLGDEAVLFLQKCVELVRSDFRELDDGINTVEKITQLLSICLYFSPEYKPGFDRLKELLSQKAACAA